MQQLYDWFGLNVALFHLINSIHAGWWDRLMLAMTWLGDHDRYPVYIAAVLLVTQARPRWLPPANVVVFAVGYVLTALVITELKPWLDFPRPLLALGTGAVVVIGPREFHHAFPSGHATFAVLVAGALTRRIATMARTSLWLYAVLVCLSRISVGAHFPADVVGGALIALASVMVVRLVGRANGWRT